VNIAAEMIFIFLRIVWKIISQNIPRIALMDPVCVIVKIVWISTYDETLESCATIP
jgi:hypothetical protein